MVVNVFMLPDALRELLNILLQGLTFIIAGVEG